MHISAIRTRWAAIGAAVAVTLGAGGIGVGFATSPSGATAYVPITPCRLADTRPAPDTVGPRSTPIGAASTLTISAHGNNGSCTGIPTTATGLQLNVTAIGATAGSFLTIWATGATQPTASSLNPQPGAPPIPNAVTTGLSAGGQFNIFNNAGSVNVLVDVVGYYTDHNHDDRYYTEAEVDAAIAAAIAALPDTVVLSAVVASNGTLVRGVGAVSAANTSVGNYTVTFDRDISACTYTATPGQTGNNGSVTGIIASVATSGTGNNRVFLRTESLPAANTNTPFHLIVVCP